ncbi:Acb2/Tad1 domain-containing protein [Burkholderia pseudomallei]|uniref:Acb2/Tad1 domain-containing protein n=1 Tax=Burkholderia pseudomallei TaxID=28450 RepID=UPI000F064BE0|nr:hypothetical protein [Burkholderia pseudomallei]CAJ2715905.1 Uncharacterised protein [Burkholderia pseudomallei]CAJ4670579.1 Uncharacterised protein [Burkholderia pseudomallei]VBX79440.1 Uncharacterised protein [Burkholderia pseudomallei]VBX79472.1 Uncharacterised protein [Burkholderia pseudomallei]VBX88803.1 Uncharacterised protein [Burkholderia pseudomallei]
MYNQHRKISGYRELSQAEIDLMNRIKAHAELTRQLVEDILAIVSPEPAAISAPIPDFGMDALHAVANEPMQLMQGEALLCAGGYRAGPSRWVNLADDHLQQGFMALTRAVAQPTTY